MSGWPSADRKWRCPWALRSAWATRSRAARSCASCSMSLGGPAMRVEPSCPRLSCPCSSDQTPSKRLTPVWPEMRPSWANPKKASPFSAMGAPSIVSMVHSPSSSVRVMGSEEWVDSSGVDWQAQKTNTAASDKISWMDFMA